MTASAATGSDDPVPDRSRPADPEPATPGADGSEPRAREPGAQEHQDQGTDTGSDGETVETGTDTETGTGTGAEAVDTGADTVTVTGAEPETKTDAGPEAAAHVDTQTDTDTGATTSTSAPTPTPAPAPTTPEAPLPPDATLVARLKLFAVCLLLTGVALSLDPGKIVGDTKIDLTINPFGFLERALYLWDGGYFGQLQNQAYGYLFPNGPFHALLIAMDMPPWMVQRVWMAVLLCAAFLGTVKLAKVLGIGTPNTRMLAGLGFALAPRVLTLLSYNSAELQPMLLLPWIIVPLVLGARHGRDPMRMAMLSGVAFIFCGGTNAASELAVLVVPGLYLVTRSRGPRKRRLLGWWLTAVFLVSFWWLVPLLLMGRYVFSFMPYTEDAATTTSVASLVNALRGTSNWMGFIPSNGQAALPAGAELSGEPWLIAVTALVAGLGVAGLVHRAMPERVFLITSLLTGTAIVVAGYTGDLTGPFAEPMQAAFDGVLSPFRNVHKFDALIRLPVVLGLAHVSIAVAERAAVRPYRLPGGRTVGPGRARRVAAGLCAVAFLATLTPMAGAGVATRGGFDRIPDYWFDATTWLDEQNRDGMTMAVPGSARGEYTWGRPMDEPMQPLMSGRWTNQQIIPWGSAGVSRLTQEIDQRISSGRGSEGLAQTLARMGVTHLLVRNDLDRSGNNGGWPARVHQALDDSPGIERVRGFGPTVGSLDRSSAASWYDQPYQAVEVFRVGGAAPVVGTVPREAAVRVTGGPESLLVMAEQGLLDDDRPVLLGDDPGADAVDPEDTVVTDTSRRREVVYSDVRRNVTNTLTAREKLERDAPAPDIMDPAWEPYTGVAVNRGIKAVTASSSEAGADASPGTRDPGRAPFAALDDAPGTSWRSSGFAGALGQWLRIDFEKPRDVSGLAVAFEQIPGEPPPSRVDVVTDRGSVSAPVSATDEPQELTAPPGTTSSLKIRVDELAYEPEYRFGTRVGITGLTLPGLEPSRTVEVPGAPGASTTVLTGSIGTVPGCMRGPEAWVCNPALAVQGEGSYTFDRTFGLSDGAADGGHRIRGQVVATDPSAVESAANRIGGYPKVTSSSTSVDHPAAMGRGAFDDDPATIWYPDPEEETPSLEVELGRSTRISGLKVEFPRPDAISRPVKVTAESGTTVREGWLDGSGWVGFAPFRAKDVTLTFDPPEGQPLEIRRIDLPKVKPLEPIEGGRVRGACGLGPVLRVNGERVDTRISGGSLEGELNGRPLSYESCTGVDLRDGANRLVVDSGNQFQVRSAVVEPRTGADDAGGTARDERTGADGRDGREKRPEVDTERVAAMGEWGPSRRSVTVSVDKASYLVVNENFNEGWEAALDGGSGGSDATLRPVRLDGWKQAWELPAGSSGTVTLRYAPDGPYHLALGIGAAMVALVAALALIRRRPSPTRPPRRAAALPAARAGGLGPRLTAGLLLPLTVLYGVWVAGAAGAAVLGGALFVVWWLGRRPSRKLRYAKPGTPRLGGRTTWRLAGPWTAAAALGLAGLSLAAGSYMASYLPFNDISGLLAEPLRGWVAQLLCLPALARLIVSLREIPAPAPDTTPAPSGPEHSADGEPGQSGTGGTGTGNTESAEGAEGTESTGTEPPVDGGRPDERPEAREVKA